MADEHALPSNANDDENDLCKNAKLKNNGRSRKKHSSRVYIHVSCIYLCAFSRAIVGFWQISLEKVLFAIARAHAHTHIYGMRLKKVCILFVALRT